MAIKKSELYSSLWESCDQLRGGMDASQYKDYVLVILFIKYISDRYAGVHFAPITVPKGASFKDMVLLKGRPTIGDDINKKIIQKIADANKLSGTIDVADFNSAEKLGSGKDMVDKLTRLIAIFENPALDFSKNRAEGDDILGDAYEYLMRLFATQSGKSKGQFYTPAEVSRAIAKVIGINEKNSTSSTTTYDPTCGSGSLLLKIADEAGKKISLYGQEIDVATAALARMNMTLHDNPYAEIRRENTLANPLFLDNSGRLKTFDYVVANPPFSFKSWSNGLNPTNDTFGRFKDFGIPPNKNGDYAFLLHIIRSMKSRAKGACILPHGVLFRGNAEAEIRTNIIRHGYIKGIIGLPANLFYGTGIPACIIVLDKENAENRKGIFMIDASKGYVKDGNKNRLREQDIRKIVDVFNRQLEIDKYSRMVSVAEIEQNDFNLNIPRYIDSQEPEDIQDIEAHLLGDIPTSDIDALQAYWETCPSLKRKLFAAGERNGYSKLRVAQDEIKNTIFCHPEFVAYGETVKDAFARWRRKNAPLLKGFDKGGKPKLLIKTISDNLLASFADFNLIDKYDFYQHLMTYWNETIQDDLYALAVDGWAAGRDIEWGAKHKEWEGRVIPKVLVISRYFSPDWQAIDKLEGERDAASQQMEEMEEELGEYDGFKPEDGSEPDKINKASVQKRLKEIKDDSEADDERKVLTAYLKLAEQEADLNKSIKAALAELDKKLQAKFKAISLDEIRVLVIDNKWLARIEADVQSEMQRISQRLTHRIKELAERYETPLPDIVKSVEELSTKVDGHLKRMGYKV